MSKNGINYCSSKIFLLLLVLLADAQKQDLGSRVRKMFININLYRFKYLLGAPKRQERSEIQRIHTKYYCY